MPTLRLEKVEKLYRGRGRKWPAVLSLDLTIPQGQFVCFAGRRGSGTSTALKLIVGRLTPDKGTVYFGSADMAAPTKRQQKRIDAGFGVVSQTQPPSGESTVFASFCPPGKAKALRASVVDRPLIKKAMALVGLPGAEWKALSEFEPGDRLLVELAGAILHSPPVLVVDDISDRLSEEQCWDMLQLLRELNYRGTTVIMACHNGRIINIVRPRVIMLDDGKIVSDENPGKFGETFTL